MTAEDEAMDLATGQRMTRLQRMTNNRSVDGAGDDECGAVGHARNCCTRHRMPCNPHGGQRQSLVPPYTRGSVSLPQGAGRKPCCASITRGITLLPSPQIARHDIGYHSTFKTPETMVHNACETDDGVEGNGPGTYCSPRHELSFYS
jgi:hypothetical protein